MIGFRIGPIALVLAGGLSVPAQNIAPSEIQLTAKKYEFSPSIVKVKRGDRVRLVVTALDRTHGLRVDAFQINRKLPKGEAVTVDFTADRAGTFPFQCSEFCGLGHKKMTGELVVE
jgi:cytochrome c oxidase subunit 2